MSPSYYTLQFVRKATFPVIFQVSILGGGAHCAEAYDLILPDILNSASIIRFTNNSNNLSYPSTRRKPTHRDSSNNPLFTEEKLQENQS